MRDWDFKPIIMRLCKIFCKSLFYSLHQQDGKRGTQSNRNELHYLLHEIIHKTILGHAISEKHGQPICI